MSFRLRIMDFRAACETVHTGRRANGRWPLQERNDVCFAIDAPEDHGGDIDGILIYFDAFPHKRELSNTTFQLVYTTSGTGMATFEQWVGDAVRFLHESLIGDPSFAEVQQFMQMLEASKSRQLHFALIAYNESSVALGQQLQGLAFNTLFAVLFSKGGPTIRTWSGARAVISQLNPDLGPFTLGIGSADFHQPMLMLLGEPTEARSFDGQLANSRDRHLCTS